MPTTAGKTKKSNRKPKATQLQRNAEYDRKLAQAIRHYSDLGKTSLKLPRSMMKLFETKCKKEYGLLLELHKQEMSGSTPSKAEALKRSRALKNIMKKLVNAQMSQKESTVKKTNSRSKSDKRIKEVLISVIQGHRFKNAIVDCESKNKQRLRNFLISIDKKHCDLDPIRNETDVTSLAALLSSMPKSRAKAFLDTIHSYTDNHKNSVLYEKSLGPNLWYYGKKKTCSKSNKKNKPKI